jgi:LytS/YehU family sensor histidine kinase
MIEVYGIVAGALLLIGAMVGILTVVAAGIHREERNYSLTVDSPGRITNGARAMQGIYSRVPGVTAELTRPRRNLLVPP